MDGLPGAKDVESVFTHALEIEAVGHGGRAGRFAAVEAVAEDFL